MQSSPRAWLKEIPPVTRVLMGLTVLAAGCQFYLAYREFLLMSPMSPNVLGLTLSGIQSGSVWQLVTFGALHLGVLHVLANMLTLCCAGQEAEPIVGRWHFLGIFVVGNIVGGIADCAAMAANLLPATTQVVGLSAGVAAALAAYATILPDLEVAPLGGFGLMVQVRARMIGIAAMGAVLCLWLSQAAPEVGAPGMAVAMLAGWAYVKALGYGNPLAIQRFLYRRRQRAARVARMPAEQFIVEEIDPILEKISRQGLHSLTRAERRILEKGREKISTRS